MLGEIYYTRDGLPIANADGLWAMESRRVDETTVGDTRVSTVHLVIDHSLGSGPPLIFETMVFDSDGDSFEEYEEYTKRYSTESEAHEGHRKTVEALRQRMALQAPPAMKALTSRKDDVAKDSLVAAITRLATLARDLEDFAGADTTTAHTVRCVKAEGVRMAIDEIRKIQEEG